MLEGPDQIQVQLEQAAVMRGDPSMERLDPASKRAVAAETLSSLD
jgi:hypothetical protein